MKNLFYVLFVFVPICVMSKDVHIDVGPPVYQKSLMALTPLKHLGSQTTPETTQLGLTLNQVIYNDLHTSGYFRFIDPKTYIEDPSQVGLSPSPNEKNGFHYSNWQSIGAKLLFRAGYRVSGSHLELEAYLYYIPQQKVLLSKKYQSLKDRFTSRKLAHTVASDVIYQLTGKPAMFNSKIVFSSDRTGHKEIYIMDWDGFNLVQITNHRSLTLSPAWSPDGESVVYTAHAYYPRGKYWNIDLFIYNIKSKQRRRLSYRRGINSGASFFPGGKNLLLTISENGHSNIFQINKQGDVLKKLTQGPRGAMNVEPAISPDGSKVVFSSDRSGNPMIYLMDATGHNTKRITYAGRYNASPSWSPDGSKIAFAGYDKQHFDIFLMKANGTGLIRLTSAKNPQNRWADNEDPFFSPDGRHIVFSSNRTGKNQLYLINIDGHNERAITSDQHNYYKPRWSPIMK